MSVMSRPPSSGEAGFFARDLRNNMTLSEVLAWKELRKRQLGVRFRRQVPIGPYIADFVCLERRLVIEIDGSVHDHVDESVRTAYIESQGFTILRFNNEHINEYGISNSIRAWLDT